MPRGIKYMKSTSSSRVSHLLSELPHFVLFVRGRGADGEGSEGLD